MGWGQMGTNFYLVLCMVNVFAGCYYCYYVFCMFIGVSRCFE